jgi:hypothetical protein
VFVASIKVPELLRIEAVAKFRKEHKLDEAFAKEIANITLDDIAELVIVGAGGGEADSKMISIFRLSKDVEVKDVLKAEKKVGAPKKVSGYEVYEITDDGETSQIIKVAPATFVITSEMQAKALADYLKRVAGKTPAKYPDNVAAVAKGLDGDIVFIGSSKSDDEAEPEAFAVTFKLGDTIRIAGNMKMKSEEAAKAFSEKLADKGGLPFHIPNLKTRIDGSTLRITASATKDEITKMVNEIGEQFPLGGGEDDHHHHDDEKMMEK